MPSAIMYIPPTDRTRDDLGGREEREQRQRLFSRNRKQYSGEHSEWLIQPEEDDINDNITINVTKQAIDRTESFLFPDLPLFQLDTNKSTPDEEWLNAVFRFNGGAYWLSILAQNGSLSGHNYVKVIPPKNAGDYPRLVAMNPAIPITFWRADDPDDILWYELFWTVGKSDLLQDYVRLENDTWVIREYTRTTGTAAWTAKPEQVWASKYPPILAAPHLPNPNMYYGQPEVTEHSIALNDAINRVASDIGKILRYHASPRTIAIGITQDKIQPGAIDSLWTVDDKDVEIKNLEMQSDLSSSMNFLTFLNDMYLAQARVVIMRGTVKDFQRVTNTGIRAVFLDMIAKNELLRWSYGILLQRICQTLLYINGRPTDVLPTITWADPLPTDELETVNRMAIEQGQGWLNPIDGAKMRGYEWITNVDNWKEAGKEDFIKKLILKEGQPQGKGGQATRLGKTSNNNSVAP